MIELQNRMTNQYSIDTTKGKPMQEKLKDKFHQFSLESNFESKKVRPHDEYDDSKNSFLVKQLYNIREALLKGRFYASITSKSQGGCSRVIALGYIKNNELVIIRDRYLLKLAGCDKNGRMNGYDLNGIFVAQHKLFTFTCPSHDYNEDMPRAKVMA